MAPQGLGRPPQSREEEEDEEGHRQKEQPRTGLAQAQPRAAGFMQGGNWGDTAGKPPQSRASVSHFPQTKPIPQLWGPHGLPSPFMPRVGVSVQCQGRVLGMRGLGVG